MIVGTWTRVSEIAEMYSKSRTRPIIGRFALQIGYARYIPIKTAVHNTTTTAVHVRHITTVVCSTPLHAFYKRAADTSRSYIIIPKKCMWYDDTIESSDDVILYVLHLYKSYYFIWHLSARYNNNIGVVTL